MVGLKALYGKGFISIVVLSAVEVYGDKCFGDCQPFDSVIFQGDLILCSIGRDVFTIRDSPVTLNAPSSSLEEGDLPFACTTIIACIVYENPIPIP
jgi:hypothetical protein